MRFFFPPPLSCSTAVSDISVIYKSKQFLFFWQQNISVSVGEKRQWKKTDSDRLSQIPPALIYVTLLKKASLSKYLKLNTQLLKKILEPRPCMAWFIRQYVISVFVCLSTPITSSLQLLKFHTSLRPATVLTKALSGRELIVGLKKEYF